MKKLKPFMFTLIGFLPAVIFFGSFLFLPSGADLISPQGDYYLGQLSTNCLMLGIFIDLMIYIIKKKKEKRN